MRVLKVVGLGALIAVGASALYISSLTSNRTRALEQAASSIDAGLTAVEAVNLARTVSSFAGGSESKAQGIVFFLICSGEMKRDEIMTQAALLTGAAHRSNADAYSQVRNYFRVTKGHAMPNPFERCPRWP